MKNIAIKNKSNPWIVLKVLVLDASEIKQKVAQINVLFLKIK